MIINYHPRYLKAIKDLAKKQAIVGERYLILEKAIKENRDITYLYISEEGKFRGYVVFVFTEEGEDNDVYWLNWQAKSANDGVSLLRHSMKDLKEKGYTGIFYHREGDQKIYRRKL